MNHHIFSLMLLSPLLMTTSRLAAAVDTITGNTGTAQSGSLTISGGTSGASFNTASSTITQSINYLSLPAPTSTNGRILVDSEACLHFYPAGNQNVFLGGSAGNFSITGSQNTGCGKSSLNSISSGNQNTGVGKSSLTSLTTGQGNIAFGVNAGSITTGDYNIFIGINAGSNCTSSEANNILIGHPGVASESNTIRIGVDKDACYMDAIYGMSVDSSSGTDVYVDNTGKLGTIVSSLQFKEDVADIDDESDAIMQLRPVSFYFKHDAQKNKQFGLIAEEVYKLFPELTVLKHGKPHAVKYHQLPALLLNELQKKSRTIEKLQEKIDNLLKRITKLEAQ